MRVFPPAIEIGETDGFDPAKDIFRRAEFGKGIANLLAVSDDPLILMLDAPWGEGKTTFIKMLAGHLRNDGFPVIYFDAFKNDHVEDGFLAIAGEVIRLSNQLKQENTPQYKTFLTKAVRAGGSLLRLGTKIGVRAATFGVIDAADIKTLDELRSDIAKETSSEADSYVERLLKAQSVEHETIEGVREALGQLANTLAAASDEASDEGDKVAPKSIKPLVVIVDELDRCKPTFALELLEKIKHIFSIPNVHFVLTVHLAQLENTVRFNYGADVDARVYLQKFYNLPLQFPAVDPQSRERVIPKYLDFLSTIMKVGERDLEIIGGIAEAKSLSLRTVERIVSCIAIARACTPNNYLWVSPIIAGLAVLKVIEPALFRKAVINQLTVEEIKTAFSIERWPANNHTLDYLTDWWTFCLANDPEDFPSFNFQDFQKGLYQYNIRSRKDIIRLVSAYMDRFSISD